MLSRGIGQAAVIGHSMGGKAAMALALQWPDLVARLLVSDIAPVSYVHHNDTVAAALKTLPLSADLTRQQAEQMLRDSVPSPAIRAFLLQNYRFGGNAGKDGPGQGGVGQGGPGWRIGLPEIAAAIPDLEGWVDLPGPYAGPTLFVTGANSDYVRPEHRPVIRSLFPAVRFVAIKNASHWVHADNPAGFQSVLDAFLSGYG
jgi:pimeloyl-ACP methyl ester carboxylesterase